MFCCFSFNEAVRTSPSRAGSRGGACRGGGGQTLNGGRTRAAGSRSSATVGIQWHSPWKLLNFKHRYRWNHAILAANQQNLLEKLKKKLNLGASSGGAAAPCAPPGSGTAKYQTPMSCAILN